MTVVTWGGSSVALEGPAELVRQVVAQLPPFYERGTDAEVVAALTVDGDVVTLHLDESDLTISGPNGPEIHRAAASRIELVLVDRLPELVAVHAGVVADERGVLLFPGRSMVGKSTLTRALLERGAQYFSDEFALLDADGLVHPYPRAMTMRTPNGSERHVPPGVATAPRPARLVALLQYDEKGWDVRDLTPGETTMGLIDNCVSVRRDPARALTALTALAESARGIAGTRGPADAAVSLLD
jgi:hypothetical protein